MPLAQADRDLASRIEASGVMDLIAYVEAARSSGIYAEAGHFRVSGGVATFFSADSLLNGAMGLGMSGRVELEEVVALEAFYRDLGARPTIDVCPFADPSLLGWLADRGFVLSSFENVLVREVGDAEKLPEPAPGVKVLLGDDVDAAIWADLAARGFTEDQPTQADHRVASASASRNDVTRAIALVDGIPAATGMLGFDGGLGHLNGDSTLPDLRGRGAQAALISARIALAAEQGADLLYVETTPGSGSQRNMERLGFAVAYTRVTMAALA